MLSNKFVRFTNFCRCFSAKSKPRILTSSFASSKIKQLYIFPLLHHRDLCKSEIHTKPGSEETRSTDDIEDIKLKILEHSLDYVNDHGWSRKSISLGAEDAGYAGVAEGLFVNEGADLVLHFVKQSNQKLLKFMQERIKLTEESNEKLNINIFIRDCLEYRLRLIIPYINVWAEAMKLLLSPNIIRSSTSELTNMVDDIWFMAGDQSTDFNWYTKRGMLAKLYASTQLYMITDQSPDFKDTWSFLNRRLDDMKTFSNIARSARETSGNFFQLSSAALNAFRNIIGIPQRNR